MKQIAVPILTVVFLVALTGCETFDVSTFSGSLQVKSEQTGGGSEAALRFPRTGNNQTVSLDAGTYRGDVVISSNRVTVRGAGIGRTVIDGNVIVNGNGAVFADLTITGNVALSANNADFQKARIHGQVQDSGNGNRW